MFIYLTPLSPPSFKGEVHFWSQIDPIGKTALISILSSSNGAMYKAIGNLMAYLLTYDTFCAIISAMLHEVELHYGFR
jgi:hypothetical protein